MTARDAAAKFGKVVWTRPEEGVTIEWTVEDYKQAYGKERWLLAPVAGTGSAWKETDSISGLGDN